MHPLLWALVLLLAASDIADGCRCLNRNDEPPPYYYPPPPPPPYNVPPLQPGARYPPAVTRRYHPRGDALLVVGGADAEGDTDIVELVSLDPEGMPVPECRRRLGDFHFKIWRASGVTLRTGDRRGKQLNRES